MDASQEAARHDIPVDRSAGEGDAQSKESDNVVEDADGAASDSPQQMSCPICLEDIKSTSSVFRRPCHHLAHFSCVRQSLPADCPVCRRSWDGDCEREWNVCVENTGPVPKKQKILVSGSPQPAPMANRPSVPPWEIVPMCCPHLGGFFPDFGEMHYSAEWCRVDNVWKDMWICYGCSNTVNVDNLRLFTMFLPHCGEPCLIHGNKSLVVDCSGQGNEFSVVVGHNCTTRIFSTYTTVIPRIRCDGSFVRI